MPERLHSAWTTKRVRTNRAQLRRPIRAHTHTTAAAKIPAAGGRRAKPSTYALIDICVSQANPVPISTFRRASTGQLPERSMLASVSRIIESVCAGRIGLKPIHLGRTSGRDKDDTAVG